MEPTDSAPETSEQPAAAWVARAELRPHPRNPRRNDKTIPEVAASIRRFGFGAPIVARLETKTIIAGHSRFGAAELLERQWAKATSRERQTWHPDAVRVATKGEAVVRFVDIDEHDAELLMIADNRIGETLSETDDEALAALLRDLREQEVELVGGTGLSDEDIKKLLDGESGEEATGTDPGEDRYKSQFGVIVICGDEAEQQQVYEQLKADGLNCKVVVT